MTSIVTKKTAFSIHVCVPASWSDEQVIDFAESEWSCGTENGWQIRRQGDPLLYGNDERVPCRGHPKDKVHIVLDA